MSNSRCLPKVVGDAVYGCQRKHIDDEIGTVISWRANQIISVRCGY